METDAMAERTLRTAIYVDGFNFYYGALRRTRWKWLDLQRFFPKLLEPYNAITSIKYFTAKIRPLLPGQTTHLRQDAYLRALRHHCPQVHVHFGHFLRHRVWMENVSPPPTKHHVYKTEEKGSDVNLALHLLDDAWQNRYDCAVVVSNDSDIAEALRMAKGHGKVIGLVTPGAPKRPVSKQLGKHADFLKRISRWALATSLLPDPIPGTRIRRPYGW